MRPANWLSFVSRLPAMLAFALAHGASGVEADPFATVQDGFDETKPSLATFAASLPPTVRPAGREVRVELVERETPGIPKSLLPDVEPPAGLAFDVDRDLAGIRVKLNEAGWTEHREWITHDPSGKALAEPLWVGRVFCARPEETDKAGERRLELSVITADIEGWVEDRGVYQPVMSRRAIRTQVVLFPNRWLALGNGSVGKATNAEPMRARTTMLWLRVVDEAAPAAGAAPASMVAEPFAVTPPAR